ncbi:MAG: 30S ribosomal protein S1 [Bacteroidales bacterium]|nr:30S ribosomal protein S1 [Bacteroidales bacterium]
MTEKESNINKEAEIKKEETKTAENVEKKETTKESPKAKETVKEEVKTEAKIEAKKETKAKAETKKEKTKTETEKEEVSEVKDETKTETEKEEVSEVKDETKIEIKDTPEIDEKEETEDAEVKEETKEEKRPLEPTEEFDWDAVDTRLETYPADEKKKLEEAYDKTLSSIVEHEVIDGIIVGKSNREVVVNIGFKSDGVISLSEVRYNPDIKVGDTIEVYVESQEDPNGQLILSHKKARILKSWDRINKAHDNDEIINGHVKSRTKGGLIVDIFGIEAFLPGSQIDVKPIRDYDVFVDKIMEFKVVKINHEYKNVVVSHKALIEDELEQQRAEIISKLEKGQVLEGTAKNITSYGVFIDLGGVDGLIHITDLSWGRINHPEEIVELDQKIKVVILDFDDNKKRIALGLKQLTPHPWDALDPNLKVGDKVKGKVVVIADYGAFIEIAPGVEGLIHVSEMSWSQHLRTAQDFLKVGDEIEAQILTLDREERKMSLGIKQLVPDPWTKIQEKYPKNSKHKAIVRNFTNFGIFVELEEGVDGLIHISDLSWSKKIKHPAEFTKIGESIEVIVLEVDEENRRLSLGHKQLEENPWDVFETVFSEDSEHKGTVVSINDKGAIVSLPYGVEGFVPMRHCKKEDGQNLKVDETLEFKILEFSKNNKKIILSHSRVYQDKQRMEKAKERSEHKAKEKSTKNAIKKIKDKVEKSTLGDLEALASLKSDMEKSEKQEIEKKAKRLVEKEEEKAMKKAKEKEEKKAEKAKEKKEEKTEEKKEDK